MHRLTFDPGQCRVLLLVKDILKIADIFQNVLFRYSLDGGVLLGV
jgi:hypothetical protein